MSNQCFYEMKMAGSKEAVSELAQILDREGGFRNDGIGYARSFAAGPATKTLGKDVYTLTGKGTCARSVYLALRREGISEMLAGTRFEGTPLRSLEGESERLHVAVELYSSEPQMGFQEHLLVADGQILKEECLSYEIVDAESVLGNVEAFNQKYGTSLTEKEVEETDVFYIGGYGEHFGEFSALDSIAGSYEAFREALPKSKEADLEILLQTAKEQASEKNAERQDPKERGSKEMGR